MSKKYETIIIFDAALSEDELNQTVEKYSSEFKALNAEIEKIENWGKRELMQGKKKQFGHYVNMIYQTDNSSFSESINQQFKLDNAVIKFKTHRIGEPTKTFKLNKRLQYVSDEPMLAQDAS